MPLHLEVLRVVGNVLVNSREEEAIVFFKDLTPDYRHEGVWEFDAGDDFLEHGAEGKERTHCGAESGVFGFDSKQGNLTLEMRLPQDGISTEADNVSSSGLCGGRGTIWVASMEACKVGVNITIDVQVACGFNNHPHVASAVQAADESLDDRGMTLLWNVAESCNLADGKGNVRASVGRDVEQHTNDRAVAPNFFHTRRSVGVDSKSGLSSWRPIVFAVGRASCFLDFLNQTLLGEGQCFIQRIFSKIEA